MQDPHAQLLRLLLDRLERVPADSIWAHRASGVRGELLRQLEKLEAGEPLDRPELGKALESGLQILRKAARERSR